MGGLSSSFRCLRGHKSSDIPSLELGVLGLGGLGHRLCNFYGEHDFELHDMPQVRKNDQIG